MRKKERKKERKKSFFPSSFFSSIVSRQKLSTKKESESFAVGERERADSREKGKQEPADAFPEEEKRNPRRYKNLISVN